MIPLAKRLRHRIVLQHAVNGKDRAGGRTLIWETFAAVWSEVGAATGGRVKQTEKGGNDPIPAVSVRIRYLAGVNPRMRVVHGAEMYRIDHVENERSSNHTMLLTCRGLPEGTR